MILRAILTAGASLALVARRPAQADFRSRDTPSFPSCDNDPPSESRWPDRLEFDGSIESLERYLQVAFDPESPNTKVRATNATATAPSKGDRKSPFRTSLPDPEARQRSAKDAIYEIFDAAWYLETNADVAQAGVDPFEHFVKHGIREGRAPNCQVSLKGPIRIAPTPGETHFERYLAALDRQTESSDAKPRVERGNLHLFSDDSVERGLQRFACFPLFDAKDYLNLNPPLQHVRNLDPRHHAFTHGFSEGRSVFDRYRIANELGLRSRAAHETTTVDDETAPTLELTVSILYNAAGNSFLHEFAECLFFDLRNAGHDARLLDETSEPSELTGHTIIVAPHEFFFVGRGGEWVGDDVVSRSVMLNTEQPQTVWFDRAVPFNFMSKGVVDMSPQVASFYGECMPATHCDLSGPPLEDRLPDPADPVLRVLPKAARSLGHRENPCEDRSVDVSFFGGISRHRERFFAQTARFFSEYKTFFYCRRDDGPLRRGAVDMLSAARHVAFHSKIVLNVHRDEFGFFEWHRIVRLGIEAGAVVVSEPCLPHPIFKPNVHYFEESGRHIQNLIEWLLRTPDGQSEYQAVKRRALDMVDRRRADRTVGRHIARFLTDLEDARP